MSNVQLMERESFLHCIEHTTCEDFDGHTEFTSLTSEQKLMWISQCAQFITEVNSRKEISA
ncbi:MAG TPA: hypothetical protein PLI62_15670 [Spirochaetota bacterium]|nr:hypothetical protein [Spirochaetota bacterium]